MAIQFSTARRAPARAEVVAVADDLRKRVAEVRFADGALLVRHVGEE